MENGAEQRSEQRLRYHWPVWFAEDRYRPLLQGQIVDLSSGGMGFTCHADKNCPYEGQRLTARFSVPRFGVDDSYHMASFGCIGQVRRVNDVNSFLKRIALRFDEPLPFKPGEQAGDEPKTQQKLNAVTI